jgi:phosphoglycerol transferase MdoB-like AlkP superfamily enzyme
MQENMLYTTEQTGDGTTTRRRTRMKKNKHTKKEPQKSAPTGVLKWLGLVLSLLLPFGFAFLGLLLSYHSLPTTLSAIGANPGMYLFSVIAVAGVFAAGSFLFKQAWAGALITLAVCYIMPLIDYLKFSIVAEHFQPWDMSLAGNAASFGTFLQDVTITRLMLVIAAIMILWCVALAICRTKAPGKWFLRLPICAIIVAAMVFCVQSSTMRNQVYPLFGIDPNDMMNQESNYRKNGFFGAFLLNWGGMQITEDPSYNKETMEGYLEQLSTDVGGETFQQPDVLVILSEAFWDPTTLEGISLSKDPLTNYRRILEENHGGTMVSNTFGGGTVRAEFEVLTSMTMQDMPTGVFPYDVYVKPDTWSWARYYKNLGYETLGVHTYDPTFYSRSTAYPNMGFDEFIGVDDLHVEKTMSGPYVSDDTFVDELIYQLEDQSDSPKFIFGITMGNHGLYGGKFHDSDIDITATGEGYTDEEIMVMENYSYGLELADAALGKLYDYVQQRERPTVVVYFGDHLPSLAGSYDIYNKSNGIPTGGSEVWNDEQKLYMFSTPYVTFANYDTGKEYAADGQAVSTYHLVSLMNDYIDAPNCPMNQALMNLYQVCPVYNSRYSIYSNDPNDPMVSQANQVQRMFTYDDLSGSKYMQQYLDSSGFWEQAKQQKE